MTKQRRGEVRILQKYSKNQAMHSPEAAVLITIHNMKMLDGTSKHTQFCSVQSARGKMMGLLFLWEQDFMMCAQIIILCGQVIYLMGGMSLKNEQVSDSYQTLFMLL